MMKKRFLVVGLLIVLIAVGVVAYYFLYPYMRSGKATMITDKYIFSVVDKEYFEGEGFFVSLKNGGELFIYGIPGDDPHNLENARRKFLALVKNESIFRYPKPEKLDTYLASKYDLGREHRLLREQAYRDLADGVRERGYHRKINMVFYKDIEFPESGFRVLCSEITRIDELTITSGGSAYLVTINRKTEKPLNIVTSAKREGAKEELLDFVGKIKNLIGTDATIKSSDVSYQDTIYTRDGVKTGWVSHVSKLSIED